MDKTIYTFRTDAMASSKEFATLEEAIDAAVAQREWAEFDSKREARDIADGAYLCVFADGCPVLVRGQMP